MEHAEGTNSEETGAGQGMPAPGSEPAAVTVPGVSAENRLRGRIGSFRGRCLAMPRGVEALGLAGSVAILVWLAGGTRVLDSAMPLAGDQVFFNWFATTWRDRLFSGHHPFGYTMDAGLGFPFGYFYFPLPPLVFSALSLVLPDAVALKLLSVLALCAVPLGCWAMLRSVHAPRPVRACAPLAAVGFMAMPQPFFAGGNVASTLIGEVAYGLALGLGMWFVGALWAALRHGDSPILPAVLAGAVLLCHLNVALVVLTLAGVMVTGALCLRWAHLGGRVAAGLRPGGAIVALGFGVGLAAWFLIPAIEMAPDALGHLRGRDERVALWLLGGAFAPVAVLGALGLVLGLWRRVYGAGVVAGVVLAGAVGFVALPDEPLWNIRCAPLYHLGVFLGVCYLLEAVGSMLAHRSRVGTSIVLAGAVALAGVSVAVHREHLSPWREVTGGLGAKPEWGLLGAVHEELRGLEPGRVHVVHAPGDGWFALLSGMVISDTGSSMSVSANLYVEASVSTGAVDLVQGRVSNLGVGGASHGFGVGTATPAGFSDGVAQLRALGVRYLVSADASISAKGFEDPGLAVVRRVVDPSSELQVYVFEVRGHGVVASAGPVRFVAPGEVVFGEGLFARQGVAWLDRVRAGSAPALLVRGVDLGVVSGDVGVSDVGVSDVVVSDERVSFTVSRVGVPVVVRMSFSRGWRVTGAAGPFAAAPSVMVVVPSEREVVLWFEPPAGEGRGLVVSWVSVVLVLGWWVLRRRRVG